MPALPEFFQFEGRAAGLFAPECGGEPEPRHRSTTYGRRRFPGSPRQLRFSSKSRTIRSGSISASTLPMVER